MQIARLMKLRPVQTSAGGREAASVASLRVGIGGGGEVPAAAARLGGVARGAGEGPAADFAAGARACALCVVGEAGDGAADSGTTGADAGNVSPADARGAAAIGAEAGATAVGPVATLA